jgi:WD40 repeat protein
MWTRAGRLLVERRGRHRSYFNNAVFSPGGRLLAAANDDGSIHILDGRSGEFVTTLGKSGGMIGVTFSPSGREIAAAGVDGRVRVWVSATMEKQGGVETAKSASLYSIAFSPDGERIVAGGSRGTATVLACVLCSNGDELAALAMKRANRRLEPRERREYLHEQKSR